GRRRHTRSKRDWSSDVCSSDLAATPAPSSPESGTKTGLSATRPWHRRRDSPLSATTSLHASADSSPPSPPNEREKHRYERSHALRPVRLRPQRRPFPDGCRLAAPPRR